MIKRPLRRKPRTEDRLESAFISIQTALDDSDQKYQTSQKLINLLSERANIEILDLRTEIFS